MRTRKFALFTFLLLICSSGFLVAQRGPVNANVTVTANNQGIFTCNTNVSNFSFGDVNANGDDFSTSNVIADGRPAGIEGGQYRNTSGSITWTCSAAPNGTFDIVLGSDASNHSGGIVVDHLEIQLSNDDGDDGSYQTFTSGATLLGNVPIGNGANSGSGNVNLRLTVGDTDATGSTTWTVIISVTEL